MPDVREIVKQWLQEHGYDGLVNEERCLVGCLLDDLIPCGFRCDDCQPGYKHKVDYYIGWAVKPEKPEAADAER